jgi:alpha-L-fucosidase
VTQLTAKQVPGKASIEAFFTAKGNDVFAILPRWPGKSFTVQKVAGLKSVSLLGVPGTLRFQAAKGGVTVTLPDVPEDLMRQPAWVLKLSR